MLEGYPALSRGFVVFLIVAAIDAIAMIGLFIGVRASLRSAASPLANSPETEAHKEFAPGERVTILETIQTRIKPGDDHHATGAAEAAGHSPQADRGPARLADRPRAAIYADRAGRDGLRGHELSDLHPATQREIRGSSPTVDVIPNYRTELGAARQ
jgi:hypothetical protein